MTAAAAYKSMLVHVGADPGCDARLALAIDLARRFEGRVIGVGGEMFYGGLSAPGGYMDAKTVQMLLDYTRERLDRAQAKFEAAMAGAPALWRSRLERPESIIADEARGADLIVATQDAAGAEETPIDAGELIMAAGLPVLVAPPGVDRLPLRQILVGWKNTLQARSAISAALPLLQAADEVWVARIAGDDEPLAELELADVAERLKLHGVAVSCEAEPRGRRSVAESLLERARERNADLVVVGAYGQPRLHQWAFGGVTRDLLARSTLPVLYAR
jgi:nucleotide-binding universal stress UspA family protein